MYKVHHFVRDAGKLKIKDFLRTKFQIQSLNKCQIVVLEADCINSKPWKPESVCLACLLPPAYSTWCLHQNKTFTLHVLRRVHSSEIYTRGLEPTTSSDLVPIWHWKNSSISPLILSNSWPLICVRMIACVCVLETEVRTCGYLQRSIENSKIIDIDVKPVVPWWRLPATEPFEAAIGTHGTHGLWLAASLQPQFCSTVYFWGVKVSSLGATRQNLSS